MRKRFTKSRLTAARRAISLLLHCPHSSSLSNVSTDLRLSLFTQVATFATLRGVIARYAHQDLSLDELRAAFLEAAPQSARLERFFAQWLDRAGAPSLTAEWESMDDGQVVLTVSQIQEGEPYDLDLEIEVQTSEGSQRHALELREREARLELTVAGEVTGVLLDPDRRLLIWKPQYDKR